MMPDVIAFHYSVMQGKTKAMFSGPTGKPIERFPNLSERQTSADVLIENFRWLDERVKALAETEQAKAEPEEVPDRETITKALLEFAGLPPVSKAEPEPKKYAGRIVSIPDVEQIKRRDREQSLPKSKSNGATLKRGVEADPQPGDRIALGSHGFFAVVDTQAGAGKIIWKCFPADISAGHAAIKPSADACRKWYFENTTIGQLEAKEKAKCLAEGEEYKPEPASAPAPSPTINQAVIDEYYGDASTHPTNLPVITSQGAYKVKGLR